MNIRKLNIFALLKQKYILRKRNIHIADGAVVEDLSLISDNTQFFKNCYVKKGCCIGEYTYLNQGTIMISGSIGKYCSIGFNVQIGQYEHPLNFVSMSEKIYHRCRDNALLRDYKEIKAPPIIGNDVWIGSGAIILQGVTIGDGACIAAGAVVTKNVEPYSVVAGVPAKLIKKRFNDETIKKLSDLQWWNKDNIWIEVNREYFDSPDKLFTHDIFAGGGGS